MLDTAAVIGGQLGVAIAVVCGYVLPSAVTARRDRRTVSHDNTPVTARPLSRRDAGRAHAA